MQQGALPDSVYNDLNKFISYYNSEYLPHSLLIAQAFCLRFQDYGKKYSLSTINDSVENILNNITKDLK